MTKAGPYLGTVRELQTDSRQTDRHIFKRAIDSMVCTPIYDDKGRSMFWNRQRVAGRQTDRQTDRQIFKRAIRLDGLYSDI